MNRNALIAIGLGAVIFVVIARRGSGGSVEALAKAIAKAEGYGVPGAIPTITNNPGDLKNGGKTYQNTGITIYATAADGWNALYRQINLILSGGSTHYTVDTTLRKMGQIWTATVSEQAAWAKNVANYLGVSVDATIGQVAA